MNKKTIITVAVILGAVMFAGIFFAYERGHWGTQLDKVVNAGGKITTGQDTNLNLFKEGNTDDDGKVDNWSDQ